MRFAGGFRVLTERKTSGRKAGESKPWRRSQRRKENGACRKENLGLGLDEEREPERGNSWAR